MRSRATPEFWKHFARLPQHIQRQARDAFELFKRNPHDPQLHLQRLVSTGQRNLYSVAVGPYYRAIGLRYDDHWLWTWIGSHEDYNRRTKP